MAYAGLQNDHTIFQNVPQRLSRFVHRYTAFSTSEFIETLDRSRHRLLVAVQFVFASALSARMAFTCAMSAPAHPESASATSMSELGRILFFPSGPHIYSSHHKLLLSL